MEKRQVQLRPGKDLGSSWPRRSVCKSLLGSDKKTKSADGERRYC